jgi:hypothetical protein
VQYGKHMGSPMTFNSAAFAAMVNSSMNEVSGVKTEEQPAPPEELKDALRRLPHVKERLENSLREEAAANAAVAAVAKVRSPVMLLLPPELTFDFTWGILHCVQETVAEGVGCAAQILAIKQAAGIRARAAAAAASRDMQRFMAELDEEFSLSSILKKQRT